MAVKFENIVAGMTLYDVHSVRVGNVRGMRQLGLWKVDVKEVDHERQRVLASWNGNSPRWYSRSAICKFRKNPPEWMPTHSFRGDSFYCHSCGVRTNEKDSSAHRNDCPHPKAVAWRKKI